MGFAKEKKSLSYGIILTLIAYLAFAAASAFVRPLGKDFPTIEIIFFQSLISFLCFIPIVFSHNISLLKPVAIFPHLLRDLGGLSSYFTYFLAIKYLGLVDATVLSYTAPFYIPFIWNLWTKEKIPKEIWWAIGLGFIGILLILKPGTSIFSPLSFIGIMSGIFSAFALVALSMLNRKKELSRNTIFYNFFVSTSLSLPFCILSWKTPSLTQLVLLLGIGFFTLIGQILLTEAYKYGAASFLSPISYSIIIYTSMISWIFFSALPGPSSFIGMLCVIAGGTLTYVLTAKPKKLRDLFEAKNHVPQKKWWLFWKKNGSSDK